MLTCFRTVCDLLTHVFAVRSRVEAICPNGARLGLGNYVYIKEIKSKCSDTCILIYDLTSPTIFVM